MERDRQQAIAHINQDLKRVLRWGKKWKTAFEPTKTHAMLVTNSKDLCPHPSVDLLEFDGVKIGFEKKLKIVGVIYDCKLNWSKMTSEMANRGKQALGFLRRLGGLITSSDLATIYKYFVRSRMEYGCASYIASSSGGLKKLDVVQRRAEKLCGITFQPLGARREASCFGLICKLLDEVCVRPLLDMCPQFQLEGVSVNSAMTRRSNVQVTNMVGKLRTSESLRTFGRSFIAQAHHIFEKLPSDLKTQGLESGWMFISLLKAGQRFLAPYQLSDIHTAADIKEFGWDLDIQELGAIGEG